MKHKILFSLMLGGLLVGGSYLTNEEVVRDAFDPIGPAPQEFTNDYTGQYVDKVDFKRSAKLEDLPSELTIHYQMNEPTAYDKKEFYFYTDRKEGTFFQKDGVDDFGMHITINPQDWGKHNIFYFIVKPIGGEDAWAGQSGNTEINYSDFHYEKGGKLEVWCIDGMGNSIEVYENKEDTQGGKIKYCKFEDWQTIHVDCTEAPIYYYLYGYNASFYKFNPANQKKVRYKYMIDVQNGEEASFDIKLPRHVPMNMVFEVEAHFANDKVRKMPARAEKLYLTERFDTYYTYDGEDLGYTYTPEKTTFKLWAPVCSRVSLRIYDNGTPFAIDEEIGNDRATLYDMGYTSGGVWSCVVPGNLDGKYYTFYVYNFAGKGEIGDPYARASGINGIRSMVLDFSKTNPKGWDDIPDVWDGNGKFDIKQPNDLSVYETHIRDLTMDKTWNGTAKQGTYKAFAEANTKYTEAGVSVTTGFDHIKELGVNAVQLMPIFDGDNNEIDEIAGNNKVDNSYNWGYNPLNYNCVEGGYSSNPFDGRASVVEFKELVRAYASGKNPTRIIMDVVYNHVANSDKHCFNKVMPHYAFRMDYNTSYYMDETGCGNTIKTGAKMVRKYIVDSVKWWANEYKIKGFRFDLMGCIDTITMREVKDAVYEIDHDNVCYGEGWGGYGASIRTGSYEVFSKLYPTQESPGLLGAFSDAFRDNLRGKNDRDVDDKDPTKHLPNWGLISQGVTDVRGKAGPVASGMLGKFEGKGTNCYQTVNYASCHDNWTLYDQLHVTLSEDGGTKTPPPFATLAEGVIACQSAVSFSSGIAFYNGGEELFRTKEVPSEYATKYKKDLCYVYGKPVAHNSYRCPDETNSYKYDRKISVDYLGKTESTIEYSKKFVEMIEARKNFESRLTPEVNKDQDHAKAWFSNDNCHTSTGFANYINHNNATYFMFFSGRVETSLGFGAFDDCVEVYNSSINGGGYTFDSSNNRITLSPRSFVVLKVNK